MTKKTKKKAGKKKAPAAKKKPRQQALSKDLESPGKIKAVTDAACEYEEARDVRIAASGPEKEKKDRLIQLMQKHKLTEYADTDAGIRVRLVPENVKCKVERLADE